MVARMGWVLKTGQFGWPNRAGFCVNRKDDCYAHAINQLVVHVVRMRFHMLELELNFVCDCNGLNLLKQDGQMLIVSSNSSVYC